MNLKTSKGFTIVELLIVIVVIAILAAISIVAYTGIQNRARDSAGEQLASQVAGKVRAYHAIQDSYPTGITSGEFTPALSDGGEDADLNGINVVEGTAAGTTTEFTNGTQVVIDFDGSTNSTPRIWHRSGTLDI